MWNDKVVAYVNLFAVAVSFLSWNYASQAAIIKLRFQEEGLEAFKPKHYCGYLINKSKFISTLCKGRMIDFSICFTVVHYAYDCASVWYLSVIVEATSPTMFCTILVEIPNGKQITARNGVWAVFLASELRYVQHCWDLFRHRLNTVANSFPQLPTILGTAGLSIGSLCMGSH